MTMLNKTLGEQWAAISHQSSVSSDRHQSLEQFSASPCAEIQFDWTSETATLLRDS